MQTSVQVERAFARDFTASISGMYAKGSDLPVVTNINPINPIGTLPTAGRSSARRERGDALDPRFNLIQEVQSIGESTFKSMTVSINKRQSHGLSMNLQYSLGKGLDNTPLLTQLTVQAESGRSDPTNLDRDLGPNPLDIRHSLNGTSSTFPRITRRTRSSGSCSTATRSGSWSR